MLLATRDFSRLLVDASGSVEAMFPTAARTQKIVSIQESVKLSPRL